MKLTNMLHYLLKKYGSACMHLFVIGLVLVPFVAKGEGLYADGMTWRTRVHATTDPFTQPVIEVVTLEQTATDNCFNVYQAYEDRDEEKMLVALIKTEGQKVFFHSEKSGSSQWYLMYDFGLQPGEGCYVYSPDSPWLHDPEGDYRPYRTYVECVDISEPTTERGWPEMLMKEFDSEGHIQPTNTTSGVWLKGLSSREGLLRNNRFEMDGVGYMLLDVTCDGKTLYSSPEAGVGSVSDELMSSISVEGREVKIAMPYDASGSVYTASGVLVATFSAGTSPACVRVPSEGVYVVKVGNTSRKILVQ